MANIVHDPAASGPIRVFTGCLDLSVRILRKITVTSVKMLMSKRSKFETIAYHRLLCYARIFNGCEVQIETSVMRVTVWHHEACDAKQLSRVTECLVDTV